MESGAVAGNVTGISVIDEIVAFALSLDPAVASFIISLVFNAIPFATVPYLVMIASYAAVTSDPVDKALMAVAGGLGAALGKMIVFYLGRGITHFVSERTRENLEFFARFFKRGVFIAVFLFAALPLPDDVLYVPLGMAGYNPVLFFVAVALGKIFLTGLSIAFGSAFSDSNPLLVMVLGVLATVIISRMDWKTIVHVWSEYGPFSGFVELVVQFFAAMLPRRYGRILVEKADGLVKLLRLRR
ncbi:MAG: VTT domain-containing protein [Crenarchaeota archaeon]|nr:VTT domain-containing protein [Thermoproteota archaeon]